MSIRRRVLAAVALVVVTAGCGGEPALAPVSGRVFYKGELLTGGSIVFAPNADKGGSGPLAAAAIAADGTYRLRTGAADGAAVGWHRVSVVAATAEGQRPLLPARYAAPDLSGLEGLVHAKTTNTLDFHLE